MGCQAFVGIIGLSTIPGINTWEEAVNSGLVDKLKQAFPGRSPQEWYVFTGLGEADGVFRLGQLLATRNLKMHFVNSTFCD
jgi:hypothetical protein